MHTDEIKQMIAKNSSEIACLHSAVHETWRHREESPGARKAWTDAAEAFSNRYDSLAFPGGYEGALDRILAGDPLAVEAGICFLELRPYFHRSGYMFKDILRKLRKAPLSAQQQARFKQIETSVTKWRENKTAQFARNCDAD
jgi:hypothetical protein